MSSIQRIQIVEFKQPLCVNVFGEDPCTASGTPCYNTFKTCRDRDNYNDTDSNLKFLFHTECSNPAIAKGVFPTVTSVSTSPAVVNIASADPNRQPLGKRAEATITFHDHPYHDRFVDPYFRQRGYNPINKGTFWGKWLARNDNYEGSEVIIRDGFLGDAIEDMQASYYILDKITGPGSGGSVTWHLSDILKAADNDRATIPAVSEGALLDDIGEATTSFTVSPEGAGEDYPAEGVVTIGGATEIITYTRVGDVFTVTRGAAPQSYNAGDIVQQREVMAEERLDLIIRRWLVDIIGIDPAWIDDAAWAAEIEGNLALAEFSATIYRPTGANELLGELLRDSGCYLVPDIVQRKIHLRVLRSVPVEKLFTDKFNILAGSFKQTRRPELRLTQLWIFYNQRDEFGSATDPGNFTRWLVKVAPGMSRARIQSIKRVYSRFLKSANLSLVNQTAGRIVERYGTEPVEYEFAIDGVDAIGTGLGDVVAVEHRELVDQHGERARTRMQIVSRHESDLGGKVMFRAQAFEFNFATVLWPLLDTPAWADATEEQKTRYAYFAADDGLIDGEPAPKLG